MNGLWLILMTCGALVGLLTGRGEAVNQAVIQGAREGVNLTFGLMGVMAFWLGLVRLAEKSGLLSWLVRGIRPLLRRLFPDVPPGHPAEEAMALNLGANLLGLGNAATPMGLVAMQHLQELNPTPERATPAMCTFLALNTSCLTLVPAVVIAIRAAAGSHQPTVIVGPTLLSTMTSTAVALLADRFFQRREGKDGGGH